MPSPHVTGSLHCISSPLHVPGMYCIIYIYILLTEGFRAAWATPNQLARPVAAVAGMRAKVNITLTVRSLVYLVLHKPLLIYVGRVAQVVSKCICYYCTVVSFFITNHNRVNLETSFQWLRYQDNPKVYFKFADEFFFKLGE